MPIIRVEMFKGRSADQKRRLVKELAETFARVAGGNPAAIHVLISDVDKEDWGIGGELALDKFPDPPKGGGNA